MMLHINNKYLNFSQNGNLESQLNDEIVEEGECTTVIVNEQEKYNLPTSSSCRPLVNSFMAAPLGILSVLGGSDGYQTSSMSSYHCALSSALCGVMSFNESKTGIDNILGYANRKSQHDTGVSVVGMGAPLVVNTEGDDYGANTQLHSMALAVHRYYSALIENSVRLPVDVNGATYKFCYESIISSFCDESYNRNSTVSDVCCPDIKSYIEDLFPPTITSTVEATTESAITEAATTVATTTAAITTATATIAAATTAAANITAATITPTEITPDDNDRTTFIAVLVSFLLLAAAILAFSLYKHCAPKKKQESQPVLLQHKKC